MGAFVRDAITSEGLLDFKSLRTQVVVQATAASTLSLTVSSEFLTVFTGSTAGQVIQLPDATTLSNGWGYVIHNGSTVQVTVKDGSGATLFLLNPSIRVVFYLQSNSSSAGVWIRSLLQSSVFSGVEPIPCSYGASANTGRYLEFWPSNPSNTSPFLIVTNSLLVAVTTLATASTTGTIGIFKSTDLVNAIASLSLTAQSSNSNVTLSVPLNANDRIAVRVTAGSFLKPGTELYILGS